MQGLFTDVILVTSRLTSAVMFQARTRRAICNEIFSLSFPLLLSSLFAHVDSNEEHVRLNFRVNSVQKPRGRNSYLLLWRANTKVNNKQCAMDHSAPSLLNVDCLE